MQGGRLQRAFSGTIYVVFSFQSMSDMCYSKGKGQTKDLIISGYIRGYSGVRG